MLELCLSLTVGPLDCGHGVQEDAEVVGTSMSGEKTELTWQKCLLHLRKSGSDGKFGICILPAMLEMMLGGGHSWETVNFRVLGASEQGLRGYSQSGGASSGTLASMNVPGQMVVEVGVAQGTITRQAAMLTAAGNWDP